MIMSQYVCFSSFRCPHDLHICWWLVVMIWSHKCTLSSHHHFFGGYGWYTLDTSMKQEIQWDHHTMGVDWIFLKYSRRCQYIWIIWDSIITIWILIYMVVELNIIMIYIYIRILPYHYTEYWKWEIILNIWFPMKPWKRPCWFHGIIFSRHFFLVIPYIKIPIMVDFLGV